MRHPILAAFLLAATPVPGASALAAQPAKASATAFAQYLRGLQAEQRSDWRAALQAYRAAVEADPTAPALRVSLAEALTRTGDLSRATAEARKAISLDPDGPSAADAWLVLGRTAAIARRPADAEEALRKSIAVQVARAAKRPPGQAPLDPDPWRLLAQLKLEGGDDAGAVVVLEDLATRLPAEGAVALRELGRVHAERGDLEGAAALYRKAVAAERRDTESWRRLAELEESRRHFDEARRAWEGLIRQDSDDPDALVALGRLELRAGDVAGARAFFDQSIHVSPDDAEPRVRVAFAWLDARRPGRRAGHAGRSVAHAPRPARALRARARAARRAALRRVGRGLRRREPGRAGAGARRAGGPGLGPGAGGPSRRGAGPPRRGARRPPGRRPADRRARLRAREVRAGPRKPSPGSPRPWPGSPGRSASASRWRSPRIGPAIVPAPSRPCSRCWSARPTTPRP